MITRSLTNTHPVAGEARQRQELSDWLDGRPWDYFVTLTHRYPGDGARAIQAWARKVEKQTGKPMKFAVFTERSAGGFVHHHALVSCEGACSIRALRKAWSSGRTDVEVYDPSRGAAHYVGKGYGTTRLVDWQVSDSLPAKLDRAA